MKLYFWLKNKFLFLIVITIISCNYTGKLTKRYKSYDSSHVGCDIHNYVSVDLTPVEKEPSAAPPIKSLFELSPQGQKAFIKAINGRDTSNANLITNLKNDLAVPPDKSTPEIIDFSRMNKRLQVAIGKPVLLDPGARIEKVLVTIKPLDPNLIIKSCNKLITEYQNVDLGKISYTNSNQFEATGSLGVSSGITSTNSDADKSTSGQKNGDNTLGTERTLNNGLTKTATASKGLGAKFNASRSMSEEVQLRQRLVALNVFIKNNTLNVYQEGISGIDLTGNIIADVQFEYMNDVSIEKVHFFDKLFLPNGTAVAQNVVDIKENYIQAANITSDIAAELTFKALYRKIKSGDKTSSESDDVVQYYWGEDTCSLRKQSVLIPKTALRPNTWELMYKDTRTNTYLPLSICNGINLCKILEFNNYKNAVDFLRWLTIGLNNNTINLTNAIGNKGHKLKLADAATAPTAAEIATVQIRLSQH